ncbi:dynamin family protein [Thermophilibacter sp.]
MGFVKRKDFFDAPAPAADAAAERAAESEKDPAPGPAAEPVPRAPRPVPAAEPTPSTRGRRATVDERVADAALDAQLKMLEARAKAVKRADLADQVRRVRAYLAQARFSVAVVGEFSRGKSTLVNALLGREAIPTGATPTTQVPIHVVGGRRDALVAVVGGARRAYPLSDEGWEDLEHDAVGQAPSEVVIRSACELLASGELELVDTPGVNSQLANDLTYADAALIGCDCAILVVSAVNPVSEYERLLLEEHLVGRKVPRVMMVLTMLDLVDEAQRPRVVDYVAERAASIGGGCPLFLAQEGLVDAWEGPAGTSAIAERLVSWLDESGHRELKVARAAEEARVIAKSLRELYANQAEALDQAQAERERAAQAQQRNALRDARIDWDGLEVELLGRCNENFSDITDLVDRRRTDFLERLELEVSRTGNPKDWWELDYPYRLKNELVSLGNALENTLQKSYGRDVAWLNRTLEERYRVKVPPEARAIADRALFRQDFDQEELTGLHDMRRARTISRVATVSATLGAYALSAISGVGMLGSVVSASGGLTSELVMNGSTERQRRKLEQAMRKDVPRVFDRCAQSVEESVTQIYRDTAADLRKTYESWESARAEAIEQARAEKRPDERRQALADTIKELDAVIGA